MEPESADGQILSGLSTNPETTIILSNELAEQIRRVGGKDWTGRLFNRIWRDYTITFLNITVDEKRAVEATVDIPREDIGIYITAVKGNIDCMVSSNHEFVRKTARAQKLFECLPPEDFVSKYLTSTT